jgi:hypothetical protein
MAAFQVSTRRTNLWVADRITCHPYAQSIAVLSTTQNLIAKPSNSGILGRQPIESLRDITKPLPVKGGFASCEVRGLLSQSTSNLYERVRRMQGSMQTAIKPKKMLTKYPNHFSLQEKAIFAF